jgi:hypothetical protein
MVTISLFKTGLVFMLFFVIASNILNYVSIATQAWSENFGASSPWHECAIRSGIRCFKDNPPALIATGTALNCLSLVLVLVSQLALCLPKFRDSFALYFVIVSEITILLSVVFSSTGWYFVFIQQYQEFSSAIRLGYSFWLMAPTFALDIIAALIGSAILGCTCITNMVENEKRRQELINNYAEKRANYKPAYSDITVVNSQYHHEEAADARVLRL